MKFFCDKNCFVFKKKNLDYKKVLNYILADYEKDD